MPLPVLVADNLSSRCGPILGHVVSVIFESGIVENVGVAAETAAPALFVHKLFPLPVLVTDILGFRCRSMSNHVVNAISESGVVENVGVTVGTASPSPSVQKLFLILFSTCRF